MRHENGVADEDGLIVGAVACLKAGKPVRRDLPGGGRLHIDRRLPFLCVHELSADRPQLAARQICVANAAYILTPDTRAVVPLINAIAELMIEAHGGFLLLVISELAQDALLREDSPFLAPFEIEVSAKTDPGSEAAMAAFGEAMMAVEACYRSPQIEPVADEAVRAWQAGRWPNLHADCGLVGVAFAPIYRQPGCDDVYPELLQRIVPILYDSGLQAIDAFVRRTTTFRPPSHRSLGRQVLIDAVHRVDRQIDAISGSFNFLLALTPINAEAAWTESSRSDFTEPPRLYYRPLTIDVDEQKRKLFAVSFDQLEDPVLVDLYQEKQREIDLQLTMLQMRNTNRFKEASRVLYGSVERPLKELALTMLSEIPTPGGSQTGAGGSGSVDCHELKSQADEMIEAYRAAFDGFAPFVELRDDVPAGLMVSGPKLLISRHTSMPRARVQALLSHEIGVHLLTYFNGDAQGLRLFRSGLADYESVQEGLAVFAEYAVGGMTAERLRLLAARVLACDAMLDGADFAQTFKLLTGECGQPNRGAFHVAMRVYRSGGLAKDAIYLRGLCQVLAHLQNGGTLEPFWIGKIATSHLPAVEELRARGLLKPIPIAPAFVSQPRAKERIAAARSGLRPLDLVAA